METRFEWDQQKASGNVIKHGVSFDEASTVFGNPLAVMFDDETSTNELREIIIGHSAQGRILVIVFTERAENVIRIISARTATKREQQNYEEHIHF